MTDFLRRNPILVALALLCCGLAAVIAIELVAIRPPEAGAAARKVAPSEAKLFPPVAASAPEAAYPETALRPLWIPTRRPAPPAVATATQPAFARGQFILQGVTIAGNTRIAMLKEKSTGRIHRVEQGRDLNGLQVAEVAPEQVTLAQGSEREVLELRVQRPQAAAPGAATPLMGASAASSAGPFAPVSGATTAAAAPAAPGVAAPQQAAAAPAPTPGFPPRGQPTTPFGPQAPSSNPSPTTVPQPQSAAPMTPEELLARRRARRNQPNQ